MFVDFEQKGYDQAKLQGVVTGAPAGSAVELFSSTFPIKAPNTRVASAELVPSAGKAIYSFTESPQLATRYLVELVLPGPNAKVLARSAPSVVYVAAGSRFDGTYTTCGRPVCHETLSITFIFPPSIAARESAKRWYIYLGLSLAPSKEPPPPKIEYLHANLSASSSEIGPTSYKKTLRLSFTIGNEAYRWNWTICDRDTESADGFGLPGYHGCGASSVEASGGYLG
jgi:hypothetical protein